MKVFRGCWVKLVVEPQKENKIHWLPLIIDVVLGKEDRVTSKLLDSI